MPTIRNKELGFLFEELAKLAPAHVAEFGAIDARFGMLLAREFPQSRHSLVVDNLRAMEEMAARPDIALYPNLTLVLAEDLTSLSGPPDVVVLRPSGREGNARMEARFAEARRALPVGGTAILIAGKHHGAEALTKMMARAFPGASIGSRQGGLWIVLASKEAGPVDSLPEPSPEQEHAVTYADRSYRFRTGPALFSKGHADPGSLLLLNVVASREAGLQSPVLDMGCGYGLLGVILASLFPGLELVLSDVDLAAVASARVNIELNGVEANARAVVADAATSFEAGACGTIVAHLPLHVGRAELKRMLQSARLALREGGAFYAVFLAEYTLEAPMRAAFGNCEILAEELMAGQDTYRVCRAIAGPRPQSRDLEEADTVVLDRRPPSEERPEPSVSP